MHKITKRAFNTIIAPVLIRFLENRFQLLLIGDGRSGTTWISEVLNFDGTFLDIFEPYHGRRKFDLPNDRLYPTEEDLDQLDRKSIQLSDCISTRLLFNYFRQPKNFPYPGTITKDISAHLIIQRACASGIRLVYIVRNPISVALSKGQFGKWHSAADIDNLLNYSTEIKGLGNQCLLGELVSTKFLEYVFTWSLLHRIALKYMEDLNFPVIFYEDLLTTPEESFEELFRLAGLQDRFTNHRSKVIESIGKKSKTTLSKNMISAGKKDNQPWIEKISSPEILSAYKILKIFDLYEIYQDSLMPKVSRNELKSITSRWTN
jgi:hypothetical protein